MFFRIFLFLSFFVAYNKMHADNLHADNSGINELVFGCARMKSNYYVYFVQVQDNVSCELLDLIHGIEHGIESAEIFDQINYGEIKRSAAEIVLHQPSRIFGTAGALQEPDSPIPTHRGTPSKWLPSARFAIEQAESDHISSIRRASVGRLRSRSLDSPYGLGKRSSTLAARGKDTQHNHRSSSVNKVYTSGGNISGLNISSLTPSSRGKVRKRSSTPRKTLAFPLLEEIQHCKVDGSQVDSSQVTFCDNSSGKLTTSSIGNLTDNGIFNATTTSVEEDLILSKQQQGEQAEVLDYKEEINLLNKLGIEQSGNVAFRPIQFSKLADILNGLGFRISNVCSNGKKIVPKYRISSDVIISSVDDKPANWYVFYGESSDVKCDHYVFVLIYPPMQYLGSLFGEIRQIDSKIKYLHIFPIVFLTDQSTVEILLNKLNDIIGGIAVRSFDNSDNRPAAIAFNHFVIVRQNTWEVIGKYLEEILTYSTVFGSNPENHIFGCVNASEAYLLYLYNLKGTSFFYHYLDYSLRSKLFNIILRNSNLLVSGLSRYYSPKKTSNVSAQISGRVSLGSSTKA